MAQDVYYSKMADESWLLKEDGYLNADTDIKKITYHPSLNVIIICTKSGIVKVLDVNSGVVLLSSDLSAQNQNEVTCQYIAGQDRILFSDGQAIGVRSDYNGVLLLDTILQKAVTNPKTIIKLELLLSEAIILKQSLSAAHIAGSDQVINHITEKIFEVQKFSKKGIKAQKWNTVCLEFPLESLRGLANSTVSDLLMKNQHTPELGVTSAVQERLSELTLGEQVLAADRRSMASEAKRRETFTFWPHMDYKWALPDQMAQAGFYHQPNASGDDRAMCFTCTVCLVCWERTDEPWSEHERHSSNCPFVMGEYTQNVPLSTTYATNPAVDATYRGVSLSTLGTSSVPELFAVANDEGLISVFDVSGKVKRTQSFFVTQFDSHILERFTQDFGVPSLYNDSEEVKYPAEKRVTALAIVGDKSQKASSNSASSRSSVRPTVICGLNIRCRTSTKLKFHSDLSVEALNNQNKKGVSTDYIIDDEEPTPGRNEMSCLYLVVYDFQYSKEHAEMIREIESSTSAETGMDNGSSQDNLKNWNYVTAFGNTNDEDYLPMEMDIGFEPIKKVKPKKLEPYVKKKLKENEEFCNVIKQHMSFYQSLIPGESDEIFIPPVLSTKTTTGSGPRLFNTTEIDSSQTPSLMIPQELTFGETGKGLSSLGIDSAPTISDNIVDLKNSKTTKELNYSRAVQCVALPSNIKNRKDLNIRDIVPTSDGTHIVVVTSSTEDTNTNFLLLYPLDFTSKMVKVAEEPVVVRELPSSEKPVEFGLLAQLERACPTGDGGVKEGSPLGTAIMVCVDGTVHVVDMASLKTTSVARLWQEKFISATYCNSLERLCASTENGALHFFSLMDTDSVSTEDEDDLIANSYFECQAPSGSKMESSDSVEMMRCFHEPVIPVSTHDLRKLHQLTSFESLKTGYCAAVPPCWSEMQQLQRQRRHPHNAQYEGEQNTKTWRLQTDTTTWDEHIFELTLPSPIWLGHVDVHFTLHASSAPPQVEVTLLRQYTSGIGHKRDVKFQVDDTVTFDALQCADNPVTSQEYLRAHNAEILAGPVNMRSSLDLTEQSGCVTLTSPKLFKSRNRTLLLHIKAVYPKDETNKDPTMKKRPFECRTPVASNENGPSWPTPPKKTEFYMGCDCIHELSVTVYNSKYTEVPHERTVRNSMLESSIFVEALIATATDRRAFESQNLALDLLNWTASVRLTRNRSYNGQAPRQQTDFLNVVQSSLGQLLRQCVLLAGRSVAHKCIKFIITCSSGAKNINDAISSQFDSLVLNALLDILDSINIIQSAGGLQWLIILLYKVARTENTEALTTKCVSLLTKIASELHKRTNPYHLLLRSRYGLYGTPLEPELFDIEPPPPAKPTSQTVTYASVVAGENNIQNADFHSNYAFYKETLDAKEVLSTSTSDVKVKLKNVCPSKMVKGLLETEPLHFVCVSASEGTRIERADFNGGGFQNNMWSMSTLNHSTSVSGGTKKEADVQPVNCIFSSPGPSTVGGTKKEIIQKVIKEVKTEYAKEKKDSVQDINNFKNKVTAAYPDCYMIFNTDKDNVDEDLSKFLYDTFEKSEFSLDQLKKSKPGNSQSKQSLSRVEEIMSPNKTLPWQQLLIPPAQQVIVVERMQSGARRFVTLDFGQPVLLTDVLIPLCHDLVSLSIDLWLKGEDADSLRLVNATDIGSRNLVLGDLQPPPLCRYLKITTVGRYGMSTARCRIPTGFFYGHMIVLPDEVPPEQAQNLQSVVPVDIEEQLNILAKLFEDVSCRYSLACSKLKDLLHVILMADITNASHLAAYMSVMKDKIMNMRNSENGKIFAAYQEAVTYQRQLNTVRNVMGRIERSLNNGKLPQSSGGTLSETCTDKLRAIAEGLLDILLSGDTVPDINYEICSELFQGLCISQTSRVQFLAATLLDRSCGRKLFWGNFLADTLARMFSSSYTEMFPQDRVFILLAYLCRKCPEMSVVLDATLKVIAETLAPLAQSRCSLLAVTVDLQLLGWLLMFLSLHLDLNRGCQLSLARWDWVVGEIVGKNGADNSSSGFRKRLHKRFFQYKQHLDNLDWTQKVVHNSAQVQALSALSNHAANLTSKLEAALKSQENFLKRIKQYKSKSLDAESSSGSTKPCASKRRREPPDVIGEKKNSVPSASNVDRVHCLVVAKGLLNLILVMDHSCSVDIFLLSCKVIARLVDIGKLKLGQLMNEEQLLKLIHLCINSELPWAPHALACLLQDILEVARPQSSDTEMETETPTTSTSTSWANSDLLSDVESLCESFGLEDTLLSEPASKQGKTSVGNNNNHLPSVYESEDSELEDFLDDILERGRTLLKKSNKGSQSVTNGSFALDSRLESGVESGAEITLRRLMTTSTLHMIHSLNTTAANTEGEVELTVWPSNLCLPWYLKPQSEASNGKMLTSCFESLFKDIHAQSAMNLENVLQLWLTLNCMGKGDKFDPSIVPFIGMSHEAVNSLVSAIAWSPGLSLRTWCTALQTLTLVCNLTQNSPQWLDNHGLYGMTSCLVNHPDFVQMLIRLLSGTGLIYSDKGLAGPSLCKALHDFQVRLQMRCDVITPNSQPGSLLKSLLLKVVYQLVQLSGPLASRQGPLDAQCKLLQSMIYLDYANADLSIAMSILESTGVLVHSYVSSVDRVKCVNIGERLSPTSNSFSGIFATVLGSDTNKQDRPVSFDCLLIMLLKLLGKLVQTPLPGNGEQLEAMETESSATTSQTDESKAEQIQQDAVRNSVVVPCLADTVLQHHPSIIRLCQALAACKASTLSMLANISQQNSFPDIGEPSTVGDAVFHVLASLAKKASRKELVMEPLLIFLSRAPQLSEPLLWFILQVLDTEEALRTFMNAGGIKILGHSLVLSSNAPNTVSHAGLISMVIQHFRGHNVRSDANTAIAAPSATKKSQQATLENNLSLVNFAPFGTIRCNSGTAQPAEVLIQGGAATHRRARTPQWSYHFYPEEGHTELLLQLPSAILLREVHLQPHLSALATCPSAVALEVSADGPSRLVPACPPLPTSGMTFIRLHLPVPEVVNCIQLRLYKPRDANNIGLSQIRVLGTSAFGGNIRQVLDLSEDDSHCKYSLGWLRLLHHCFTLPENEEFNSLVVASAAEVPDLLPTCCGLLLVPAHIPPLYLPNLEKVLCKLSLHDRESGLNAIRILLESRSSIAEPLSAVVNVGRGPVILSSAGCQSACELLYQICSHQDADTIYRVALILEWLHSIAEQSLVTLNTENCSPVYVSAIASILWSAKQSNVSYNLPGMISTELFWSSYQLQSVVGDSLKYALDSLLCSLCYIKPELFPMLLRDFGIQSPTRSVNDGIANDGTDDTKQTFETDSEYRNEFLKKELLELNFTTRQFETIALVSRSPTAIQQLLDSGLPKSLTSIILEFCSTQARESTDCRGVKYVTDILKFFTSLSEEKPMRDWLGSAEGSSFWFFLLSWLCEKPFLKTSSLQSEAHAQLEEVCVKFLSKCCLCHPENQEKLATVLCEVMRHNKNGISGFMRRLILQLLLENEKIPVSIKADEMLYKNSGSTHVCLPIHPAHKQTHDKVLLYLSTNITLAEILENYVSFTVPLKTETSSSADRESESKNEPSKGWCTIIHLSMAAGVTAKDKRAKDAKNQATATPQLKKKRYTSSSSTGVVDVIEGRVVICDAVPHQPLPLVMTLAHVLRLIESKGVTADWPCVHLTICRSKDDKNSKCELNSSFYDHPFSNALQVFSSMGGLALLAEHLPTVYPETVHLPQTEKPATEQSDSDWVKIEGSDDIIYEDIEVEATGTNTSTKSTNAVPNVPPHSLAAFGLFLRLPGYAEVLLKDRKKALCLLRLVLGVTDDGEGGDIFQTPVADSLPTLPFKVLRKLYDVTPLSTDDGRLLRKISINIGVVHLLLACLGIFTHQSSNNNDKDSQKENKAKDDRQLYWAKGTGFGTGSTQQSWNVEQALMKQKSEEEHVTVLLQVLASYINPGGEAGEELAENVLPPTFHQLLANSVLLPALCSYLRNDSVLDMSRHIPLYRAALQLLRAIAASSQLVTLLVNQKSNTDGPSVSALLKNMKTCVNTYASKLRSAESQKAVKKFNSKLSNTKNINKLGEQLEEIERDEGLAMLMPDIQATANMVCQVTDKLIDLESENDGETYLEKPLVRSVEEKYLRVMKQLQFDTFEMITELPEGGYVFVVSHHFESNARLAGEQSHPARVKRLAQEAVTLATSLPLSYSSSVFVRCDTDRLDIMKVLITGPADTPYSNGCFELDVFFPSDYPSSPMLINLETTGHHSVRFNPNLYNDGKVCLSVLNTWHGRPEEKWNAQTSSFLQVLVSIQSLILVPEPYFNEPGYERSRGTPLGTQSSKEYNANVCQATVRWAMLEQIVNPCPCFKDVIHAHFYLKRKEVIAQVEGWIKDLENDVTEKRTSKSTNKRSATSSIETFKKNFSQLKEKLATLAPPDGFEEEDALVADDQLDAVNGDVKDEQNEIDADIDMEKMVNDMCEIDALDL